jgi:hypothetical protein
VDDTVDGDLVHGEHPVVCAIRDQGFDQTGDVSSDQVQVGRTENLNRVSRRRISAPTVRRLALVDNTQRLITNA